MDTDCSYCGQLFEGSPCALCLVKIKAMVNQQNFRYRIAKYNLSAKDYLSLLSSQSGKCAICYTTAPDLFLFIDHDHSCCRSGSCGKCVRGLLCRDCNLALGLLKDNTDSMIRMISYMM